MATETTDDPALAAAAESIAAFRAAREQDAPPEAPMLESALPVGKPSATPIAQAAIDLIVNAEVSSRAYYEKRLIHPVWPMGKSGVTIGIGYDIGTVSAGTLQRDWTGALGAAVVARLAKACGVLGVPAAALPASLADISVSWDAANGVFLQRSIPVYVGITEAALPNTNKLSSASLGALVSLVYNRGASFNLPDDRYREMRAIKDHMTDCAFDRIPAEIRAMKRIWQNEPNSAGLLTRRDAEAALFEQGLRDPAHPTAPAVEMVAELESLEPATEGVADAFAWLRGWLRPIIAEPTRDQLMIPIADPTDPGAEIVADTHYVAIRLISARIVNARRWTSLYHGAVHATCNMLSESAGTDRLERQAVLAPDGFRDIDPKGQSRLLQVDRPLFGPVVYRGDLRLAIGLFSVRSSDLAAPYLSLIGDLSQMTSLGFLAAAQPFIAPISKAADLLFGTSDSSSLECGTVRGFGTLRSGIWACLGATREELPKANGLQLDPNDGRLLDAAGNAVERFPYLVFRIERLDRRDNWTEVPALKTAWDAITTALLAGRDDDAKAAAKSFRRLCLAGGELTQADALRLADKADAKVAQVLGPAPGKAATESVALSFRALELYAGTAGP